MVTDRDRDTAIIQVAEPVVRARMKAPNAKPGDTVRVRLQSVDVGGRDVRFEPVS